MSKSRLSDEEKQRILAEIAAAEAEVVAKAERARRAQEKFQVLETQMQQLVASIQITTQTVQEKLEAAAATKAILQESTQSQSSSRPHTTEPSSNGSSRPVTSSQSVRKSISASSEPSALSAEAPASEIIPFSAQSPPINTIQSERPPSVQGSVPAPASVASVSAQAAPVVSAAVPVVPAIPLAVLSPAPASKPVDGDERTPEQIFAYYKDRADQGHARSQYNVGVCYERGQGVERSERMAFQYYLRSSKQGFAFAEYSLGQCYLKGIGVGSNQSKAIELFKKAAAQKLERAIEALRDLNVK